MGVAVPFTHCVTFVKVGDSVAFCDDREDEVFWYPKVPRE